MTTEYQTETDINQRSKAMEATTHEDIDMTVVQRVFEKAGNAIVDASRLAKAVSELEAKVAGLANDLDYLRARNKELDEHLVFVRKARDEAEAKAHNLEATLKDVQEHASKAQTEAESRYNTLSYQHDGAVSDLHAMTERWHAASKERDDAMLREMELQDRLKEAEGKLEAIQKALGIPQTAPVTKEVTSFAQSQLDRMEEEPKQETPPQFGGPQTETTEERERREAQSRDEAGRFGPKVVGGDWGSF